MDFSGIAALLAQVIPLIVGAYEQLRANDSTLPPVETLLANADANYDAIIALAKAQLNPPAA